MQPQWIIRRLLLPPNRRLPLLLLIPLLMLQIPRSDPQSLSPRVCTSHDASYKGVYDPANGSPDCFEAFAQGFADGSEGVGDFVASGVAVGVEWVSCGEEVRLVWRYGVGGQRRQLTALLLVGLVHRISD